MRILGRATSSNVQAVMWGAAELGLSPEREDYGHVHGGTDTPEFRALNPMGRVPVLVDGDLAMFESSAILRYGDGGVFWPADPVARARVDTWAEWAKVTVQTHFARGIFLPLVRGGTGALDRAALAGDIAVYEGFLAIAEEKMGDHAFLLGDAMTLADIVFGHLLYRWFTLEIDRLPRPVIEGYYARLTERPAFAEHVMVDYAGLRAARN